MANGPESDVSWADLAAQPGITSSDLQGYGSQGSQIDPSGMSGSSMASAGVLGAGALGFGALLAGGPGQLPAQYLQAEGQVPGMQAEATGLEAQGGALVNQGTQALGMAQRGELTPEQAAQLEQYGTGLTNQSRQMFASMGRNPDQDTAFINQTANVDAQINAMAQQQIQTTITLGLGEISSGNSLTSTGAGIENAANNILLEAGKAQVAQDQAYSSSLTGAFTAIASMAAKVAPMMLAA